MEKKYAIASELATRYRTSAAMIYEWTRQHKFPRNSVVRIGKKLLFDLDVLDEWAQQGGSPESKSENLEEAGYGPGTMEQ